jgi:glyoxylase-like metal-dependent hydrolase (beta-lactamase superfamily II)
MQLYSIETGYFKLDGGAMFGVVPKSIWNKFQPADENNLCRWAMRCLLIEDGKRLILVDTGIGDKQDQKFFSHYYLHGDTNLKSSLAAHGFSPEDITDVFLTHLHFDHVGGSVIRSNDKLITAFANATYWSNQQHWDHAVNPNPREKASFLKENILPLHESGQLQFINHPYDDADDISNRIAFPPLHKTSVQFSENINIRFVSGHTESMMLPEISWKGKKLLYAADLLPCVGHVPLPYIMAYDIEPLKTMDEKKSFLDEYAQPEHVIFFEHDPENECCTLQQTEKGVRVKEKFALGLI